MHSPFSESTNILITKAYLPDLNKHAHVPIFDKACTITHIRNTDKKMQKNKFEIIANSLFECNRKLNKLFSNCFNSYKLRPDQYQIPEYNYLENYFSDLNVIQNIKKNQNELFILFVEYINQPCIDFKTIEPIFTLSNQAIEDLNKITDFNSAFKFFDTYGYSYPFTSYETNQFKIRIIRVISEFVSNQMILENKARSFLLQRKRKPEKKTVLIDSESGKLIFESLIFETPQFFKCIGQVNWIPLPKLINKCTNNNLIENKLVLKYLSDCWLIRDTSHILTNRIFSNQILAKQIRENKNFYFDKYWFDLFIKNVYLNFENLLFENFYSKNNFSFNFDDKKVIDFLQKLAIKAKYEIEIMEVVSSEDFLIFTNDTESLANSMMLYYTHEWIQNDPKTFLALLKSIRSISALFNHKPICILINYKYYGCYKKLKGFYLHCNLIEYQKPKINKVQDKIVINAKSQSRINFDKLMKLISDRKTALKFQNNLALSINYFTFPKLVRRNIVEIDLSKNCLCSIEMDSFEGMISLEKLNLRQNNLQHVKEIFKNLKNLKYLNLSMNRIYLIEEQVFDDLENLVSLNLSNNRLNSVPSFPDLIKLRELNLGGNKLKKVEKEFENLKNLTSLFLCFNSIEKLNYQSMINLKKIEFLFLNSNNLKQIDPNIFSDMKSLKILLISGNENLTYEQLDDLKFSCDSLERILFVFRNKQNSKILKYFHIMYKYFGSDVKALKTIYFDNFSDNFTSRI